MNVPYYAQWETPSMIKDFLSKDAAPSQDPNWENSGAPSPEAYEKWSGHICGMACLKMALAYYTGTTFSLFHILNLAIQYGAYKESSGNIAGMIYAPAVNMLQQEFNITSKVLAPIAIDDVQQQWNDSRLFIASVHPSIRQTDTSPPARGGHLVLVTNITSKEITFHNPSGSDPASQINVTLEHHDFNRFFAQRGILLTG
ncbi:C39 family peptidase [Vreelandella titanicae]|uniref:Peptidase C39-like domain-containing protein n=1 Tax=Vreelandella titanicae TaxID=664683 RepID=A0A558J7P2_9GAMM|nr:C39 family peptidase [Halomonas titanicae]TVU89661.1 hypothetical protein FQP89_09890 [Halomonas titanicae]